MSKSIGVALVLSLLMGIHEAAAAFLPVMQLARAVCLQDDAES